MATVVDGHSYPGGQTVQVVLSAIAYEPGVQVMLDELSVRGQAFPAVHEVQDGAFPTEYVPGKHWAF